MSEENADLQAASLALVELFRDLMVLLDRCLLCALSSSSVVLSFSSDEVRDERDDDDEVS